MSDDKVEIITHGNCLMCGKELTEGLFFCKECEAKMAESYDPELPDVKVVIDNWNSVGKIQGK